MAEIGLIASIIGVAGAAAKLSIGLHSVAKDLGSAAQDVRGVAIELSAFSQVLSTLSSLLEFENATNNRAAVLASDIIDLCKQRLDACGDIFQKLNRVVKSRNLQTKISLAVRIRWLFYKSRMHFHKSAIESLKSTLTLLISSIHLSEARTNLAPKPILKSFEQQVDCQLVNTEDDGANLEATLRIGKNDEFQAIGGLRVLELEEKPNGADCESGNDQEDENDGIDSAPIYLKGRNLSFERLACNGMSSDSDSTEEMMENRALMISAREMIKIQTEVQDFAHEILDIVREDRSWSWKGKKRGRDPSYPAKSRSYHGTRSFTRFESPLTRSATQPSQSTKPSCEEPYLKIKDALGRIFSVPWPRAQSLSFIRTLLTEAFEHNELFHEVKDAQYDLYGPDGDFIVPSLWGDIVRPGLTISMKLRARPKWEDSNLDDKISVSSVIRRMKTIAEMESREKRRPNDSTLHDSEKLESSHEHLERKNRTENLEVNNEIAELLYRRETKKPCEEWKKDIVTRINERQKEKQDLSQMKKDLEDNGSWRQYQERSLPEEAGDDQKQIRQHSYGYNQSWTLELDGVEPQIAELEAPLSLYSNHQPSVVMERVISV